MWQKESPILLYGWGSLTQDVSFSVTIEDGGATLQISGNSTKKINFPYTITTNTTLD